MNKPTTIIREELKTQIAEAMWRSKETFTEWTEIKVPIKYLTNDKPEKCNVIMKCYRHLNSISKITHGVILTKRNASFPK